MPISWEQYQRGEEEAAFGKELERISKAVAKKNEGRNLSCFPVLSFGWKDADLEPEGCTGIKRLGWKDDDTLFVIVGGHKTFFYEGRDKRRERQWMYLCEMTTGYSCDGDTDDFTASFEDFAVVPVIVSPKTLKLDMRKTVDAIIKAAEEKCDRFEKDMGEASNGVEKL